MLYMPFDTLYLVLVLPAILFAIWAQYKVKSSFKKYSKQKTINGMTGAEAAREVLRRNGVSGVQIARTKGNLTDHFDPRTNMICLSENIHDTPSVAAVGIAAHEAGHAIQYANAYIPIKLRAAIIPITNIGSALSMPLVLLGIFLEMTGLINIGIILFGAVVVFQLITLPVEFNASRRAIYGLRRAGVLDKNEVPAAKKVLSAAALTYVGALIVSLAQLIRLLAIVKRR